VHELAIAESVVEVACRCAAGRKILEVELEVGHLRQVVPSALQFSFGLVAEGTEAEGAELVIRDVPAAGMCRTCRWAGELPAFPLLCAECGSANVAVTAGEELLVATLELDEEPLLAKTLT
jgi:hydrogenase nickel incorporation protein HypA/HybF